MFRAMLSTGNKKMFRVMLSTGNKKMFRATHPAVTHPSFLGDFQHYKFTH
jgi:hypothetical protein